MKWDNLTMSQKQALMKIYVNNGITNLNEIVNHYNRFAEGGPVESTELPKTNDRTLLHGHTSYIDSSSIPNERLNLRPAPGLLTDANVGAGINLPFKELIDRLVLEKINTPNIINTDSITKPVSYITRPSRINRFDDGGTKWKALDNIDFKAIPDSTFTRDKTGAGSIEYFQKEHPEGITYPNRYHKPHPSPGNDVILYNPKENDEQDIRLDALHIMPKDATYDALNTIYREAAKNSDVVWNAKHRYDEDVKNFGKEKLDSFIQYFNNEADGLLRNMFIEGTPEYISSKRYYPDKKQLREWNKHILPEINAIQQYLETGERPQYILPEVIITPDKKKYGGKVNRFDDGGEKEVVLPEIIITPEEWQIDFIENFGNPKIRTNLYKTLPRYVDSYMYKNNDFTDDDLENFQKTHDYTSNHKKLYDVWNQAGRPNIKEKDLLTVLGMTNPHYIPILNTIVGYNSNTIISELSHAALDKNENFNELDYITQWPEAASDYFVNKIIGNLYRKGKRDKARKLIPTLNAVYRNPKHYEYKTHSIIEPVLKDYILGNLENLNIEHIPLKKLKKNKK